MKCKKSISVSMLMFAALKASIIGALTGAPITKFEPSTKAKLGSVQKSPVVACIDKSLNGACSFPVTQQSENAAVAPIQQDPAVVACQGKKPNDACQKVVTTGGVIRNEQGMITGGTAEGLSPIRLSGTCVVSAPDSTGNTQLRCTLPMEKASVS